MVCNDYGNQVAEMFLGTTACSVLVLVEGFHGKMTDQFWNHINRWPICDHCKDLLPTRLVLHVNYNWALED